MSLCRINAENAIKRSDRIFVLKKFPNLRSTVQQNFPYFPSRQAVNLAATFAHIAPSPLPEKFFFKGKQQFETFSDSLLLRGDPFRCQQNSFHVDWKNLGSVQPAVELDSKNSFAQFFQVAEKYSRCVKAFSVILVTVFSFSAN